MHPNIIYNARRVVINGSNDILLLALLLCRRRKGYAHYILACVVIIAYFVNAINKGRGGGHVFSEPRRYYTLVGNGYNQSTE